MKFKLITFIFTFLTTWFAYGQLVIEDQCDSIYKLLSDQYDAGHYTEVEQAWPALSDSCAQSIPFLRLRRNLEIARGRMITAGSLFERINLLRNNRNSKTIALKTTLRCGIDGAVNIKNMNKTGWNLGMVIGARISTSRSNSSSFGIDLSYGFLKQPFTIYEINNKDQNQNYKKEGYLIDAVGYNKGTLASFLLSFNDETDFDDDKLFGYGGVIGLELININTTYVKKHYYESNYVPVGSAGNTVSYLGILKEEYDDNKYFSNTFLTNISVGFNVSYQPNNHLIFIISPRGSFSVFSKFAVAETLYQDRPNFIKINLNILYVSKR